MLWTGVVQVMSCGLLALFSPYPAREIHENNPHPPVYERLLTVFRLLLPMSYMLMYALTPLIPSLLGRLEIAPQHKTLVFSVFLGARVVSFGFFGWWSGWHGRWRTPVWTTAVALTGFTLTLLAPNLATACVGLALFGFGLGGIYTGALYYVMEVGASEVEAGGSHEALIGGGYTLGPLIGLLGLWAVQRGSVGERVTAEQATAVFAVVVAVAAAGIAFRMARRKVAATSAGHAQ
jgi:MFS family permease